MDRRLLTLFLGLSIAFAIVAFILAVWSISILHVSLAAKVAAEATLFVSISFGLGSIFYYYTKPENKESSDGQ